METKTATHTPGPWRISDDDPLSVEWPGPAGPDTYGHTVAETSYGGRGRAEQEANAKLIAAAPDLAEALRDVDAAVAEAEESGEGITDDVLRAALDGQHKGTMVVMRSPAWTNARNALHRARAALKRAGLEP